MTPQESAQRIAELEDQVYNLTLYLRKMETHYPIEFNLLKDRHSGFPGYSPLILK